MNASKKVYKMTPSFLAMQIKELRTHLNCLEAYMLKQKKHHKKLDDGNQTYDPIEYHAMQLFIHTGIMRAGLDLTKSKEGADGKGLQWLKLRDGSLMKCYQE